MFSTLVLALGLLGHASASSFAPSSPSWLQLKRSIIVKMPTPGYPLWLMDKANAPIMYSQAENYYWETKNSSAVLLNLTMSLDHKTLLINHQAILPMENGATPPMIEAYQVPAETTPPQIKGLADQGLFNRYWEGLTLGYRFLALDYDRLVWADPESGPYSSHEPTLRFRIMGLGAHSRSDVLDSQQQMVLHVKLAERNQRSSDDPERSYHIVRVWFETFQDSYAHVPALEPPNQEKCTIWSWKCADKGLYGSEGKPAYRFIWRSRFDKYGRIGSLRHAVFRKMSILKKIGSDAGPAMVMSFFILMIPSLMVLVAVIVYKRFVKTKLEKVRMLHAFDDRLLGEDGFGEKYVDVEEDEDEVPPPLPPRPTRREENLIDLEAAEEL